MKYPHQYGSPGLMFLLFLLFLCLFSQLLFVPPAVGDSRQNGWEIVQGADPLPHFRAICSVPPQNNAERKTASQHSGFYPLWVAGFRGVVYRSSNGGENWAWNSVPGKERLFAIHFDDAQVGWTGGWGGTIYTTHDGGKSWTACQTGTKNRITGFSRSDSEHLWAVGDAGTVLLKETTTNKFKICHSFGNIGLRCISVNHFGKGLIVGYGGTVWFTGNNGQTWRQIKQLPAQINDYYGCYMGPEKAWIVGSFGTVLHSDPTWQHWQSINLKTRAYLRHIFFIDENIGFIIGYGVVFRTGDGGLNWQKISPAVPFQLLSATSPDGQTLWVAGEHGALYKWQLRGHRWEGPLLGIGITLHDMTATPQTQTLWAIGEKSTVLRSEDEGATWHYSHLVPTRTLHAITFTSPHHGWIVGEKGALWSSRDRGQTWRHQSLPEKKNINAVSHSPNNTLWVCGQFGLLYTSRDEGRSWLKVPIRFQQDLNKVVMYDEHTGLVVGEKGLICKTVDGGKFFLGHYTGLENDLWDIYSDDQSSLVVGQAGIVMETFNAGQGSSWNVQVMNGRPGLHGVTSTADKTIWVVGDGGQVWSRLPHHKLWQNVQAPRKYNLRRVLCLNQKYLLACGENSLIIRRKIN
ncbi:WD40/YVTN/BNR-like repeat-containing protein [candidate division CSSED10-310 bacterium]|uniref:WD40/YVTN/BNR-like repeat-containing protein n=1 Tax=candidate division CSSED10-310 bacterium TaxID=2855610 RepID=A0ABV6Z3U4_UNCC1